MKWRFSQYSFYTNEDAHWNTMDVYGVVKWAYTWQEVIWMQLYCYTVFSYLLFLFTNKDILEDNSYGCKQCGEIVAYFISVHIWYIFWYLAFLLYIRETCREKPGWWRDLPVVTPVVLPYICIMQHTLTNHIYVDIQ